MKLRRTIQTLFLFAVTFNCSEVLAEDALPPRVDFNRHIRPILSDNCFSCHGNDEKSRKAKLRLDTPQGAVADLGGYAALAPGKPLESELYKRLVTDDKDERMPPAKTKKTLTSQQIALLKKWIEQGGAYSQHWAYVKPVRAALPASTDDWSAEPIDRFIVSRLVREGLKPAPDADRVTLIRRLHFDLIGLPPTPAEVEAFVGDTSPQAYEKIVDQLLASPHFGERLAIVWLDLVRYADTVGYHGDQDHNIAPYRDYVIKSFNDNLPFDQFTIEQIAGDLLPNPTMWQQIATGYNRMLQTSHEGGVQPKEYLAKYFADRVRNFSEAWLGATMGCAECHNHKFDPYTMADFYSLGAFFADVDEAQHFKVGSNALPSKRPPEVPVWDLPQYEKIRQIDAKIAALENRQQAVDAARQKELAALKTEKTAIEKQFRLCMVTKSIEPRQIRVLPRGNWLDDSGAVVQPAIPAFLGTLSVKGRTTRLDLARWLVSTDNPLAARVFVNRLWAGYFGGGLCASLTDFGAQSSAPDHPELLDWLAVDFMESRWDMKRLVKQIVMSRAYRMSSLASPPLMQRDPNNRLFARQGRHRLTAELVRDSALAVSGLLRREIGGPSVKPYQPAGYYRHLNFPKREYKADMNEGQYRRAVYMHWQRQFLHPMLKAFDAPMREECTAQRPRSNTPLASLVLLNDPSFVEAARAFAVRMMQQTGDEDARIKWGWKQALSRESNDRELAVLRQMYREDLAEYRADPGAAAKLLNIGMYKAPVTLNTAELAAWTSVARAILNLNEMVTRN